MRTRFDAALLRGAIDRDQTEFRAIAEDPFKVIEQRPVNVAAHIDPAGDRA